MVSRNPIFPKVFCNAFFIIILLISLKLQVCSTEIKVNGFWIDSSIYYFHRKQVVKGCRHVTLTAIHHFELLNIFFFQCIFLSKYRWSLCEVRNRCGVVEQKLTTAFESTFNSRKMIVRQQNRINVKIGLIHSFPRIPFIYMSLLSHLAITCKGHGIISYSGSVRKNYGGSRTPVALTLAQTRPLSRINQLQLLHAHHPSINDQPLLLPTSLLTWVIFCYDCVSSLSCSLSFRWNLKFGLHFEEFHTQSTAPTF